MMNRWHTSLHEIKQTVFIIRQLALRDRKRQSASTMFGTLWQVINPFVNTIVMILVFTEMFGNSNFSNYPLFVLIGTIFYSLFVEGTESCLTALSGNRMFLIKSPIAWNIYPLEKVYVAMINFMFSSVIFLLMAILYGVSVKLTWLLIIPDLFIFIILILGIGKILSIINVLFADITYFYKIFTLMVFYASALFYDISHMNVLVQKLISINPVYIAISICRSAVLEGSVAEWTMWIKLFVYAVAIYSLGTFFYRKKIEYVIEKI